MNALLLHLAVLLPGADPVPAPEDVKAGWVAFAVFLALAVAVALLGFSMTRHLRKIRSNAEAGVFGPVESSGEGAAARKPRESAS
jgi:hypothetical protein